VRNPRARSLQLWTWGASLALHVVLIGGFGWLAFRTGEERARAASVPPLATGDGTIAVDLPGVAEGTLTMERPPDPRGDPPRYFGGAPEAQLDDAKHGRGGVPTTVARPTNLSDRDERVHLTPELMNRLDLDQQQRIKSANERATREDRRASKEPMELSFLASGDGTRAERRKPSPSDPSRGARESPAPSVLGSSLGASGARGDDASPTVAGSSRDGSVLSAAGLGVHDGRAGVAHQASANVMRARPDVVLAAVSVPATRNGRPRDDIESDQEVATTLRSIVHASTAAGLAGQGSGGIAGGGDPGAGGHAGAGSTGRPVGPGDSAWWDLNTNDPRLLPYFRRIHQKLDPLWAHAFPLRAALDLRQGTVIFAVTISADGSAQVDWPPARASGIPEFDRNCYEAIRKASPFDPIPSALGTSELRVRMPFDAQNPIVK
jgi:TonB family protein